MSQLPRHQCLIYSGAPSTHLPPLAVTIRERLATNHRCLYLNSPTMVAGMRSYLSSAGVDVVTQIAKASLALSSDTQQRATGVFNVDMMMNLLADAHDQAIADGYDGLWASGDMTWEFGPEKDLAKLLEYEWRLEEFIHKTPTMSGVCQYHADQLPLEAARQAVLAHPTMYVNETLSRLNPYFREVRMYGAAAALDPAIDTAIAVLYAPER